jgi:broad specificity phosphatase PhoE
MGAGPQPANYTAGYHHDTKSSQLVAKRAEFVRQYIKGLQAREVVVVTHGDFIQHLANQWRHGIVGHHTNFGRVEFGEAVKTVFHDVSESETRLQRTRWRSPDDDDYCDAVSW